VYIGTLSRNRGIALMLDVMARLEPDDALLLLGGVFSSPAFEAETMARLETGLGDRVRFLGRVPRDEVPRYLASAEVLWMASEPSAQFSRPTVATKIYEGAAVGLAVLASDLPGRRVVADGGFGVTVPPSVEGHLGGVAAMGERGRVAVRERFSWEALEASFLDFYARLCSASPRA
jgi:glycosyltransferase involved in cell wall biosynthesis